MKERHGASAVAVKQHVPELDLTQGTQHEDTSLAILELILEGAAIEVSVTCPRAETTPEVSEARAGAGIVFGGGQATTVERCWAEVGGSFANGHCGFVAERRGGSSYPGMEAFKPTRRLRR